MASQNLNIVLTTFGALTVPITTAQAKTLSTDVQQLQYIDNRQTLGISILANIYILNNAGGTDYRTNLPKMVSDAEAFTGAFPNTFFAGVSNDMLDQFEAVTDWNTAFGRDSAITNNLNTMLTAIKFLQSTPETTLRAYLVFLRYANSIKGV